MHPRSLADFHGAYRESGDQLVFQTCPVCGSTGWNVYVNPNTGLWMCFAGGHGGGGHVSPGALTSDTRRAVLAQLRYRAVSPESWPSVDMPDFKPLSAQAQGYLARRGITPALSTVFRLVELANEPRVVVPFIGTENRVVSWIARDYTGQLKPKYTQAPGAKPLYVLPSWQPCDEIVLVEGVFDAIAVYVETGKAVAAIGGTHMSARSEQDLRQLVRRRVTLLLDHDTGGITGTRKLINQLRDRFQVESRAYRMMVGADPDTMRGRLKEVLHEP